MSRSVYTWGYVLFGYENYDRTCAKSRYVGAICFDGRRGEYAGLMIDRARINDMPQWWNVRPEREYWLQIDGRPPQVLEGQELIDSVPIEVDPGASQKIRVRPLSE